MSRKTLWLTFAALCMAGCVAAVVIAPTGSSEPDDPSAGIDGLRLVGYDDSGSAMWSLSADSVRLMQDTQTGSFLSTAVEFFEQGEVALLLSAGRVDFTPARGVLTQSPSLRALSTGGRGRGYTLSAQRMTWWREEETLSGENASAVFSSGSGQLTAPMMELDLSTGDLRFEGGILMSIELEQVGTAEVSAESASVIDDQVTLERSVVVHIDSDTYRCDRMTLEMTQDEAPVSAIALEGGVSAVFSQGEMSADTLRVTSAGWEAGGRVRIEFELELDEPSSTQDQEHDA